MPIVIDDESDDDLPLFARPVARMPANKDGPGQREEPDWMKSFKSPTSQALNADDDSDDGIMDIFQRHKTEEKFEMKSTPAKMVRSPPANAPKTEDGDKDDEDVEDEPIEIDDDDEAAGDGDGDDEEPAAKTKPKTPTPKKLGSQSANADRASVRAQAEKTAGTSTPNRPGEVPLHMPSAVNRNKVFFELEGTGEAVDLEGDVGVVGRLLSDVSEKHGSGLQMDMKGVIYNARILSTPSSVVILAVHANEAKVESITHDFVQLRRDPVANGGLGATLDGYLGVDSDDEEGAHRAAAGHAAAAAVRAMDDVSDHEGDGGGGKRKGAGGGSGARKSKKLGADGKRKATGGRGGRGGRGKAKKKPAKRPKK